MTRDPVSVISFPDLSAPRRRAAVAQLAPGSMSFLSVPLTPARAAALAAFTVRADIDPQALVLDLLDDTIFNISDKPSV